MFTGIVTGVGHVVSLERRGRSMRLVVRPPPGYGTFRRGESVAVAGVCVTAVEMDTDHPFSDHRIALATTVVRWLQGLR